MNYLPILNGWQRTLVGSSLYDDNVIQVNSANELYSFSGKGWLNRISVITTDENMLIQIKIDDIVFKTTPFLVNLMGNSLNYFQNFIFNITYNNTQIYGIEFSNNSESFAFNSNFSITVQPSTSSGMQIFEYQIDFIKITDINAFVSSLQQLQPSGAVTQTAPQQSSSTTTQPSSTTSTNIPTTSNIIVCL